MRIFKYNLDFDEEKEATVELPKGAKILKVAHQKNQGIKLWAAVDEEEAETDELQFEIVGTGWEFPSGKTKYFDMVIDGLFVWHIFQRLD